MQACLFILAVFLTSQLSDSNGTRYPSVNTEPAIDSAQQLVPTTISPSANAALPAAQPSDRAPHSPNHLRATNPRSAATSAPQRLSKVAKPDQLFQTLTQPAGSQQLVGVPLSLAQAVQSVDSRDQQTHRVSLYWQLSQIVAEYYLAAQEELELQSLQSGISQPSSLWNLKLQVATARKQVALNGVRAAQLRLQKELELTGTPLPTDLPHCGAYETRFSQIFQGSGSPEAEQLSRLLPLRYQELGQQAADATAARQWLLASSSARSPQDDGTLLLKAYQQLALERRTFVSTAYQYNTEIARYTELAVPEQVNAPRLVAMLIKSGNHFAADWQRSGIRRASAEETHSADTARNYPSRTFAKGSRSQARRVSPAGKQREPQRSIVVGP